MSLTCWTTLWWLRSAPPPANLGPQVSAAAASFPRKRGWHRSQSPAQLGGGYGSSKELGSLGGGGEELVTWANLPQGNEVSSRLLGGNGGGRIPPASDSSRERNIPLVAPAQPSSSSPAWPAPRNRCSAEGVVGPPWPSPEAGVSFRPGFPTPPPPPPLPNAQPQCPGIARLGEGPRAGRMSPHGKRADGQALGQPRPPPSTPPPSTPRAPDRGPCEPCGPLPSPALPGAQLRGAACGWPGTRLASTHLLPPSRVPRCPHPPWLVKHRKIPGTVPGVPSLLCPL